MLGLGWFVLILKWYGLDKGESSLLGNARARTSFSLDNSKGNSGVGCNAEPQKTSIWFASLDTN